VQSELIEKQRQALVHHDILRQNLVLRLQASLRLGRPTLTDPLASLPSSSSASVPAVLGTLQQLQAQAPQDVCVLNPILQAHAAAAPVGADAAVGAARAERHAIGDFWAESNQALNPPPRVLAEGDVAAAIATGQMRMGINIPFDQGAHGAQRSPALKTDIATTAAHQTTPSARHADAASRRSGDRAATRASPTTIKACQAWSSRRAMPDKMDALLQLAEAAEACLNHGGKRPRSCPAAGSQDALGKRPRVERD
jgi:hypothetical protein